MAGNTLHIDSTNFETELGQGAALIDFHAGWCAPCKAIAPLIDELAALYKERGLKVGKIDIDEAQELATRFGITGVPTLIFLRDGEQVDQLVGAHPREVIEKKIESLIS